MIVIFSSLGLSEYEKITEHKNCMDLSLLRQVKLHNAIRLQ